MKEAQRDAPAQGLRGPCYVVPEDFATIQSAVQQQENKNDDEKVRMQNLQ